MLKTIPDYTPAFPGYNSFPKDSDGKFVIPTEKREINGELQDVIVIERTNTVNFGGGLIGLCDGSKIADESWLLLRKRFILREDDGTDRFFWSVGGSDAAPVQGVSKWANARMVYDKKMSVCDKPVDAEKDYMFAFGHINEPLIAEGFQALTNMNVVKNSTVFFREDIGFMQANVDYMVQHPDDSWSILEIKTTSPETTTAITFSNGDAPLHYKPQAYHYGIVLGAAFNIKGTFFACGVDNILGHIKRVFVPRNKEDEAKLLESEKLFESYLRFQTPPPLSDGSVNGKDLQKYLGSQQTPTETPAKLSEKGLETAKEYLKLSDEIKEKKKELDVLNDKAEKLKATIIEEMDGATITESFIDENGELKLFSYASSSRMGINQDILKTKYPEIYEEVAIETVVRRFTAKKPPKSKKAVKK